MKHVLAVCLLTLSGAAQTFVVDASNGPGTNYTTIAAAAAAVPSGSTLIVRAGFYNAFAITGKSLSILGDPGVLVSTTLWSPATIGSLSSAQQVVVRNLWFFGNHFSTIPHLQLSNCQGAVLLDDCGVRQGNWLVVTATACDRLVARGVRPEPGSLGGRIKFTLNGTNAVLDGCALDVQSGSAVEQLGGTLQVVNSVLRGAVGGNTPPPALALNGGDARLLGATTLYGGFAGSGVGPAIGGSGAVRLDPGVVLNGASPPIAPGVLATTVSMPRMTTGVTGFNQVTARLEGTPGHIGIICLALPGPRVTVPWSVDAVWLDGATLTAVVTGVVTPAQPVTSTHAVPAGLLGLPAMWQGVSWDPIAGWQLSNPTLRVLP